MKFALRWRHPGEVAIYNCRHVQIFNVLLQTATFTTSKWHGFSTCFLVFPSLSIRCIGLSCTSKTCQQHQLEKKLAYNWQLWISFLLNFALNCSNDWLTRMSVLVIFGRKCTLAASCAVPCESRWVCAARSIKIKKDGTDRQTDGRTDAVSVIIL